MVEITRDAQSALARLKLTARATIAIREALGHLKTIKVVGPAGVELAVDLRKADEGTIARDLSELFLQLGAAAAEKGMGVVFLLDEVQFADESVPLGDHCAASCDAEEHADHARRCRPPADPSADRRKRVPTRSLFSFR